MADTSPHALPPHDDPAVTDHHGVTDHPGVTDGPGVTRGDPTEGAGRRPSEVTIECDECGLTLLRLAEWRHAAWHRDLDRRIDAAGPEW